ncbi:hypothetical protein EDB83DRAFT_2312313 [Lactarius deliciosus]|nr:hypothetical protein EDB83DRAFT_2312313 [Lactarius deliciosus]
MGQGVIRNMVMKVKKGEEGARRETARTWSTSPAAANIFTQFGVISLFIVVMLMRAHKTKIDLQDPFSQLQESRPRYTEGFLMGAEKLLREARKGEKTMRWGGKVAIRSLVEMNRVDNVDRVLFLKVLQNSVGFCNMMLVKTHSTVLTERGVCELKIGGPISFGIGSCRHRRSQNVLRRCLKDGADYTRDCLVFKLEVVPEPTLGLKYAKALLWGRWRADIHGLGLGTLLDKRDAVTQGCISRRRAPAREAFWDAIATGMKTHVAL